MPGCSRQRGLPGAQDLHPEERSQVSRRRSDDQLKPDGPSDGRLRHGYRRGGLDLQTALLLGQAGVDVQPGLSDGRYHGLRVLSHHRLRALLRHAGRVLALLQLDAGQGLDGAVPLRCRGVRAGVGDGGCDYHGSLGHAPVAVPRAQRQLRLRAFPAEGQRGRKGVRAGRGGGPAPRPGHSHVCGSGGGPLVPPLPPPQSARQTGRRESKRGHSQRHR